MFCQKCGSPVPEGAQFCGTCGAPVGTASAAPSPTPVPSAASATAPTSGVRRVSDVLDQNYYQLLRIEQTAGEDEVRSAVRTERTRWSDRVPKGGEVGAKARAVVARIAEAEATLLDPAKRAEYDRGLEGAPESEPVIPAGEKDWLEEAFSLFTEGDVEMSEVALERALSQQADNPNAWFLAASIYLADKKYDQANRAAQQLLLLDPGNPSAYGIRGDVLHDTGAPVEQCIDQYQRMFQTAQARGNEDYAREANEKLVTMRIQKCMRDATPELQKLEDAVNNSAGAGQTRRSFEALQRRTDEVRSQIQAIYSEVKDPSDWFKEFNADQMGALDDLIKGYEEDRAKAEGFYNRPLVANAVALGVIFVVGLLFGGAAAFIALLVCGVAINYLNSGAFFGLAILGPNNDTCFMATMGKARCLLLELAMIVLGVVVIALVAGIRGM